MPTSVPTMKHALAAEPALDDFLCPLPSAASQVLRLAQGELATAGSSPAGRRPGDVTRAAPSTAPPSGFRPALAADQGASTTGTRSASRAPWGDRVAAKLWSAVDSLISPTITTAATSAAQRTTATSSPAEAS